MKKERAYHKHRVLLGILFFVSFILFVPQFQGVTLAVGEAEHDIAVTDKKETVITDSTYVMRQKTQVLKIKGDITSVKWVVVSGKDVVKLVNSPDTPMAVIQVEALTPGYATIAAEVTYLDSKAETRTKTLTCVINTQFAIQEKWDTGFRTIKDDERASLFLKMPKAGEAAKNIQLTLNFGEPKDSSWTSDNEDVVKVADGRIEIVGAGKTTIHAAYLPDGATEVLKDKITVYVVPNVRLEDGNYDQEIRVHSETDKYKLFASAAFNKNGGSIKDKIDWVIGTGEVGKTTVIADSYGYETSDMIELQPSTPFQALRTVAKAGVYTIKFFPQGVYKRFKDAGVDINDIGDDFYYGITLIVYGEFRDQTLYLDKGDSFDIVQAFNVTQSVFDSMFSTQLMDGSTVVEYANASATGSAIGVGDAVVKVDIKDKAAAKKLFDSDTIPGVDFDSIDSFNITIHVSDGIKLDRTHVTLALGATLQLRETTGASDGKFTWTTSNKSYVSVDKGGMIKGLQVTPDNKDVTIKLTQVTSSGYIRYATCSVRVVSTVTDIKLNYDRVNLEVDKTLTVLAKFTPDISTAPITWITNEEEIVKLSVSSDNKSVVVTGLKPGVAVISAVNTDNFVTASVTVTVLAPIKSIKLEQTKLTVKLNQEVVKLKATYTPSDATSNDLVWSSSNTSVATVDKDGVVSLHQAGTSLITVSPAYNPYLTMAQCELTVLQSATGFALSKNELTLETGKKEKIQYTMNPPSATTEVFWKSMNTSIATVASDGTVTAVGPGKTYIVATTDNGFSGTCEVVVTKAASGVTLDVYNLKIAVGDTYQVVAAPNPVNSTEKSFIWKSKDSSIATVNSSGKVTGVKAGETIITVKTKSGSVEYLYVTVYDQVASIKLNYTKKTIGKGKKFTLKAIFTPANATNKKVMWTSSNKKVVSVTSKGVVSGLRGGVAVITAVAQDGGHSATCMVTVKQPVTRITLNKSSYALGIGKTLQLKATVKSNYASNQKLQWTSSNVRIASVNARGLVKGIKKGTVTIRCKATDGSGEYATCKIRVVRQVAKITLNRTTLKMLVGQTKKLRAKVSPASASFKTINWSTSDSKVATIDSNGNITALSVGNCKIYAKAKDNGKKRTACYVYVSKAVPSTAVNITQKDMILVKGTSTMLAYSITPNNTTDRVTFSCDNKRVATVNSLGRITARKPGSATVTIRTSSGKIGMIDVTVVGLNRTSVSMGQYERVELWVEEIANGVRWYSENPSIASVEDGSIVSRTKGKTRIVAMIKGIRLYCKVKVR